MSSRVLMHYLDLVSAFDAPAILRSAAAPAAMYTSFFLLILLNPVNVIFLASKLQFVLKLRKKFWFCKSNFEFNF